MGANELAGLAGADSNGKNYLQRFTLEDKYTSREGPVYLSGIQALVRLPLMQKWRDEAAGLRTAGFISGYRGSPLGGYDEALWKARKHLEAAQVTFQPGVNEDLALTAVWGTQQVHLIGKSKVDGVFGLWYAKGPGVDRSVDVLKHANHAGSSAQGGVLLVAGDDHGAYSSTLPHQSDHVFAASMVPVLYPCNVQEYMDLGLHGWAMSRFSGCFVGFKALADTVESSASVDGDPFRVKIRIPQGLELPPDGLNCRLSSLPLGQQARAQEALMQDYKIYAALAYARANRLNHIAIDSPRPRLGIVASGKSYVDVLEALQQLGISAAQGSDIGIRLFKVSMPWPLEPDGIREFATGLEEILVVEEKRQVVEYQLKEQLYNWRDDVRPRVIGKFDEKGEWVAPRGDWLLSSKGDLSVAQIARVIAQRVRRFFPSEAIDARLRILEEKDLALTKAAQTPSRPAYYCSGCPHNSSTKLPEGSIALAGIGCHVMATAIYPEHNKLTTHMGGEGAPWIGQAPYSERKHVFANLGDGTYFHSGYLALRAAVAAKVNITYKILFNDAVAMTGGQPVDGVLSVPAVAKQCLAEGVRRVVVVSEDLKRYTAETLPQGVELLPRDQLTDAQKSLRETPGATVLIYDQTCAAEKRRRRKKGTYPNPPQRMFINSEVCEGCGDCGKESNCTSILPLETPLGRKRVIDQSSCNKDYSCAKGFCPSFVSVEADAVRKQNSERKDGLDKSSELPAPIPVQWKSDTWNILVTGIGGTGVITVGAIIGTAAHLEGKKVSVLDMTGMSQKNGSVTSHVRISTGAAVFAQRIATGEADLLLGCDLLTSSAADAISKTHAQRTYGVVNTHEQPTGSFAQDPDWTMPTSNLKALLGESMASVDYFNAHDVASIQLGDALLSNMVMVGYAWQKGLLPLDAQSLLRAIELNGVSVAQNTAAFHLGRACAATPVPSLEADVPSGVRPLDEVLQQHEAYLERYQSAAYAGEYRDWVRHILEKELRLAPSKTSRELTRAAANGLFRLMAYKDEYEVARLYSGREFRQQLENAFVGVKSVKYHLAPPVLAKAGPDGRPRKIVFGRWMGYVFPVLAQLKFLRGTCFDPFGHTEERRTERALVREFKNLIDAQLETLSSHTYDRTVELARVAESIRGFGHVKEAAIARARKEWKSLTDASDSTGHTDEKRACQKVPA